MADHADETPREAGPAETLVAVAGLGKQYGKDIAVANVSLVLRAGEVLGLVGANGSGKTTTLRLLAGVLRPNEGGGKVLGFDLRRGATQIRSLVGYMSQRLSLYAELSVFENMRFRAEVYGLPDARRVAEAVISAFGLSRYAGHRVGSLSGGWARRLQLAATLVHSPRVILLDEPTVGLDAESRRDIWHRIVALADAGAGVIVSTHDLAEAERFSQVALFADGQVVSAGQPFQVAQSTPAVAFLLSGTCARTLSQAVERVGGVIASYPEGSDLRLVADPLSEPVLRRLAADHATALVRTAMRVEDAALALSNGRIEASRSDDA
jgi:ABC-2 type transport system ATP-binding protein